MGTSECLIASEQVIGLALLEISTLWRRPLGAIEADLQWAEVLARFNIDRVGPEFHGSTGNASDHAN